MIQVRFHLLPEKRLPDSQWVIGQTVIALSLSDFLT